MDSKTFFDTVVRMREAQKAYFKSHRQCDLQRSKQIDTEIERVQRILWEQHNPLLFPDK